MNNLGVLLAAQLDPPDLDEARHWYEQAAAAGHTGAMNNLGYLLAAQLDPPDLDAGPPLVRTGRRRRPHRAP